MQIEVFLVAVLGEPFARRLRGAPPHRHNLQRDHVALVLGYIAEEVGDAEPALLVVAREREAGQLALAVGLVKDRIVPFGGTRPIAVGRLRGKDLLADRDVEHAAQHSAQFVLRPSRYSARLLLSFRYPHCILVEHALVEMGYDRFRRHHGDRSRSPENQLELRQVAGQLGAAQTDLRDITTALIRPNEQRGVGPSETNRSHLIQAF